MHELGVVFHIADSVVQLFPKYSGGIYREENATTVVSRGLGTHSVPVRIFNPPELVVLDFYGDKA